MRTCQFVCWSLTSLCHSNGHIETMPAREINPFTALTRIRYQFLRTQWSTSNHSEWTRLRLRPLSHRGWLGHVSGEAPAWPNTAQRHPCGWLAEQSNCVDGHNGLIHGWVTQDIVLMQCAQNATLYQEWIQAWVTSCTCKAMPKACLMTTITLITVDGISEVTSMVCVCGSRLFIASTNHPST